MNILIIDDDEQWSFSLLPILQDYKLHYATSIQTCIEKIKHVPLSLIILDLVIPDVHEFDLLKKIKSLLPAVPVIVCTFQMDIQLAVQSLKHGATDYIPKENVNQQLSHTVASILKPLSLSEKVRQFKIKEINVSKAAIYLGMKRTTLLVQIKKLNIAKT